MTETRAQEIDATEFSNGFDAGNYASAYETEDYELARGQHEALTTAYASGFLVGFFSSFELSEVGDEELRETLARERTMAEKKGWQ